MERMAHLKEMVFLSISLCGLLKERRKDLQIYGTYRKHFSTMIKVFLKDDTQFGAYPSPFASKLTTN